MQIEELKTLCKQGDQVNLTLRGSPGRGGAMRLFGTHGPRGKVMCYSEHNDLTVVRFRSAAVLKALDKLENQQPKDTTAQ